MAALSAKSEPFSCRCSMMPVASKVESADLGPPIVYLHWRQSQYHDCDGSHPYGPRTQPIEFNLPTPVRRFGRYRSNVRNSGPADKRNNAPSAFFSKRNVFKSSTPSSTQREAQVAQSTDFVTLNVIVTDRNGHYVEGLSPDQFEIYDNNVKQEVTHFSIDDSPASLGIVYEVNENDTEQLSGALNALKQFVSTLQTGDDFFFVAFNKRGSVTTEFIPSPAQILEYMQFVSIGDPFSLYDSIYFATERLKQSPNIKKALLVISDAKDNGNSNSYRKLRYRVRGLNAQIYIIGLAEPTSDALRGWFFEDLSRQSGRRSFLLDTDTGVGRLVLEEMSRASGGSYFPQAESESELAGICTQIKLELHRQYTFGFYSNVAGGKWHTLKIRLRETGRSGYTLSYREGYLRS